MAEAGEEVVPQEGVEAQVVEEKPESPPIEPSLGDELTKEPGGDSPEETYARRRARELRQTREQLERERIEKARLEGELQALRSQPHPAQPQQKVFTIAEVNAAVDAGQITRADGDRYIEEVIIPKRTDDRLQVREIIAQQQEPLRRAATDIGEFSNYIPGLKVKGSPEFNKAADKYRELVGLGYPADIRTERVAVEMAHGDLATLRRKHEIAAMSATARTIPVDGGGQASASTRTAKVDLTKAPSTMQAMWDREGIDDKARERQYRIYLDLKAQKQQR